MHMFSYQQLIKRKAEDYQRICNPPYFKDPDASRYFSLSKMDVIPKEEHVLAIFTTHSG